MKEPTLSMRFNFYSYVIGILLWVLNEFRTKYSSDSKRNPLIGAIIFLSLAEASNIISLLRYSSNYLPLDIETVLSFVILIAILLLNTGYLLHDGFYKDLLRHIDGKSPKFKTRYLIGVVLYLISSLILWSYS